jgi:hypothetical protein
MITSKSSSKLLNLSLHNLFRIQMDMRNFTKVTLFELLNPLLLLNHHQNHNQLYLESKVKLHLHETERIVLKKL